MGSPSILKDESFIEVTEFHGRKSLSNGSFNMLQNGNLEVTEFIGSRQPAKPIYNSSNLIEELNNKLVIKYYEALNEYSSGHQVFELLDEYANICDDLIDFMCSNLKEYPINDPRYINISRNLNWLKHERDSWKLAKILYKDRLECEMDDGNIEPLCYEEGKIISDRTLVEKYYERDAHIRQCQLVCDWLESVSAQNFDFLHGDKVEFFADHAVAWENTLHHLINDNKSGNMISNLDPDAPIRQGKDLHYLDKEDDDRLLKYVMAYIRCGKIDDAENLCLRVGQPWRAAILEGWKLYHDPNFDDGKNLFPVEGNPHRDIWKIMCAKASTHSSLDTYEKAVYGIMSGNLSAVIPVCKSWHDLLWAHLKVYIDHQVEKYIRDASQSLRESLPPHSNVDSKLLNLPSIFDEVNSLMKLASHSGLVASTGPAVHYEALQQNIILDNMKSLMQVMRNYNAFPEIRSSTALRFMVHFILFLQKIGKNLQEDVCTEVLHSYTKLLVNDQCPEVVSWYTSHLPEALQIEVYTSFLILMSDSSDCQYALDCAKKHNLPVHQITKTLVESIRSEECSEAVGPDLCPDTSTEDIRKIKALSWLMFEPTQREEAILQTNSLIRKFLLAHKMDAAKQAFRKLPDNSINLIMKLGEYTSDTMPISAQNAIKEYLCYEACLSASDSFANWNRMYHNKPIQKESKHKPTFTEKVAQEIEGVQFLATIHQWEEAFRNCTKLTVKHLYNVILFPDGGWLVDVEILPDEINRRNELMALRRLCIPQVFSLLMQVLSTTQQHRELLQAHDILVAPERDLLELFSKEDIRQMLNQAKDISVKLLMGKFDEMGFSLL